MKKSELVLTAIQVPLDYLMLILAGYAAYFVRFAPSILEIRPVIFTLSLRTYTSILLPVAFGWILLFAFTGLYHINPNRKLANDLSRVIFGCSTGLAAIALYIFFKRDLFDSRFIVLASWGLSILFVTVGRIFLRAIKAWLFRHTIATRKIVLIGTGETTETLLKAFQNQKGFGYTVIAHIPTFSADTEQQLKKWKEQNRLDEIIFTHSRATEEETLEVVDFCNEYHVTFKYSADLFSTYAISRDITTIVGVPIVELKHTRLDGWGKILKRIFDIIGSLILLIVASPLMLVAALAILLETGRPIIFKNERVGEEGKKFITYKFRSMRQTYCIGPQFKNSAKALAYEQELIAKQNTKKGPVYKIGNDPRITLVGRILRYTSADELPQLLNVLSGTMSLVGPRPHQPREVARYEKHHKKTHTIEPGITGLAQISGRSDLSFEEEVRLDTFYIEHWSLLVDFIILLKTPFVLFKKRKAL